MKIFIRIIPILLLFPFATLAQSLERDVIGSAGDYSADPSLSLSWTVGEVAVTSVSSSLIVTEGFQQAEKNNISVNESEFLTDISLYPNPVKDVLNFNISSESDVELVVQIYDITGKQFNNQQIINVNSSYKGMIDCSALAAGNWIIKFSSTNKAFNKTFKLIKIK